MKSVRLLPIVIFAALALLLFKGIGLVTNGGYVLTGPTVVLAEGEAAAAPEASIDSGAAAMPADVELTDTSPTIDDTTPTLATKAEVPPSPSEAMHGSSEMPATESTMDAGASSEMAMSSEAVMSSEAMAVACPTDGSTAAPAADAGHGDAAMATGCPPMDAAVNEHGDAVPMVKDGTGKLVPLMAAEGDNSQDALLGRLSERRAALDQREADIDMRTALLDAAEKRLDEKAQELSALEAKVAALVDEKQAAEEEGFKAVVSMYEGMKPKDAAKIFDTLGIAVLLKVARAMNPRKMSPILAAMSPDPAQKLTTMMAATENTDVVTASGENLGQLPQIVGK